MASSRELRWISLRTRLRSRSQRYAFYLGLFLTTGGAWAWYEGWIGPIRSSLIIGVGSSILAAAIVAYLSPANEAGYRKFVSFGIKDMWSSRDAVKGWISWMERAQEKCVLFGIAHGGWCNDPRFKPALQERLSQGVSFRMYFLNPNCKAAEIRAVEEKDIKNGRNTQEHIRESISKLWDIWLSLSPAERSQLRLFVYDATASCGLTWIDQEMLVTHYLAGLPDITSPALLLEKPGIGMERSLYDVYADNLNEIGHRGMCRLVDENNIHEFVSKPADVVQP